MTLKLTHFSVRHVGTTAGGAVTLDNLNLMIRPNEQITLIRPSKIGEITLLHTLIYSLRKQSFLSPQMLPLPPHRCVVTTVLAAGCLPQWHCCMAHCQSLLVSWFPIVMGFVGISKMLRQRLE